MSSGSSVEVSVLLLFLLLFAGDFVGEEFATSYSKLLKGEVNKLVDGSSVDGCDGSSVDGFIFIAKLQ